MNIKELREKKNLSQQELADATGIPRDRIGKWEQGKGNPKIDDYRKLEEFFREDVPGEKLDKASVDEKEVTLRSLARSVELSAEARLIDSESRKIEARNMERLVALLEMKFSSDGQSKDRAKPVVKDTPTDSQEEAEDLSLDKRYTKGK